MRIDFAAQTTTGRRHNNEDALIAAPELGLFAVADGMGGYDGGEVASRIVIEVLEREFRRNVADPEATWPFRAQPGLTRLENILVGAARAAQAEIVSRRVGPLKQMGATLAALAFGEGLAFVAHAGDSRVYRVRGGELRQLTHDHSLYAELEASGVPDLPPREICPFVHVVTRAIGMEGDVRPDVQHVPLAPDDVFLVCSDGLYEVLPRELLLDELRAPPVAACPRLVAQAFEHGSKDNITAIVLRLAA